MVDSIRLRRQFDQLSASKRRGRSGPVWVTFAATDEPPAAAYAVSTAVGNAVVRNRVRRRLRAHLGLLDAAGSVPRGLYLIGVRPEAAQLGFAGLGDALESAMVRATAVAAAT